MAEVVTAPRASRKRSVPLPRFGSEHRPSGIGVRWRVGALAGVLVAALVVATPAHAQQGDGSSDPAVGAAQARADQAANTYFDALMRSQQLDAEVAQLEQGVAAFEQRVAELRDRARGRAVDAYKRSGTPVVMQLGNGVAMMDSARRSVLLDSLNARDNSTAAKLRDARDHLDARRQELKVAQQEQAAIVDRLKADEQRLNGELVTAQNARRRAASPGAASQDTLAPVGNYVAHEGEHPQHNDPWMVCTRRIESGGNYRAYNSSGPYYGAYQFTQSTWNSTANHAGRGELVGVDPRDASEYDQDDMAWTLYQWQGKGPWGGRC